MFAFNFTPKKYKMSEHKQFYCVISDFSLVNLLKIFFLVRKDKWVQNIPVMYYVRAETWSKCPQYIVNLISNLFGHQICLHIWSNNYADLGFSMLFVLISIVQRNSGMFDNDNSKPLELSTDTALNPVSILNFYQILNLPVSKDEGQINGLL